MKSVTKLRDVTNFFLLKKSLFIAWACFHNVLSWILPVSYGEQSINWCQLWEDPFVFFRFSSMGVLKEMTSLHFLAHLSRRLTGELIVYPCSGVRPSSVVHRFQRSSPLKPLGQSKPNFIWSILRKGEQKFI